MASNNLTNSKNNIRLPSETPYAHQLQNFGQMEPTKIGNSNEDVCHQSVINYELEPAPHTIIDGSAIDVDIGMGYGDDDPSADRNQYRFQTVVPNLIETGRNTIAPNTNLANLKAAEDERMRQMMEMMKKLQSENEKLK
jgi:hypothetical protein